MRSENSVKNSLYAIVGQAVSLTFGFVTRIAFVRILGEAYLGVNGVLYSVLSLLSLTELGMGTAFTFALYAPIERGDQQKIGQIMNLYALAYRLVALAVTVLGLLLIPFLPIITADVPEVGSLTLIYLLFLANSASSYLFSYKRALITASQQDYRNSLNLSLFSILQNGAQLVLLVLTGSYLLYLTAQLVCTLASNLCIAHTAGRMFPYLRAVKGMPDRAERGVIARNVRDMFMTRFGSVAVTGTDNLLIASVDVILVGLYSNYLLLLQTIQTILTKVIEAVTASVGSLMADETKASDRTSVYRDILFAVAWMYGFSAIALDTLMGRFITIAFGAGLEIPAAAVHLMCLNFLIAGLRQPNAMFISAAGVFRPVRWRGFVEAAVNLVASAIFLLLDMGLVGVLLGTTVSHLAVGAGWELACVSKHCLPDKTGGSIARDYLAGCLKYGIVLAAAWLANGMICALLPGNIAGFFLAVCVTAILPNLVMLGVFCRTREFGYFAALLRRILAKFGRRSCK